MSETTSIEWCDATFNPWWGCQKVSPACDHCYAERDAKRYQPGKVLWGVGAERRTFGEKHWNEPLRWARTMPAKLGRRPRVFCASMGDWLDLDAPLDQFVRLLDTIRRTPELDWLLLSKRIGNWRKRLEQVRDGDLDQVSNELGHWICDWLGGHAPATVWLGATVVNQDEADRDVPKLLLTPARVRFLSIEPMLGPINLAEMEEDGGDSYLDPLTAWTAEEMTAMWGEPMPAHPRVDWVICGGESGPHARPMHPDWVRSLRDQCAAAGVPFLFKQWGEHSMEYDRDRDDPDCRRCGEQDRRPGRWINLAGGHGFHGERVHYAHRIGKKAAGRLLDGRTHDGFPGD